MGISHLGENSDPRSDGRARCKLTRDVEFILTRPRGINRFVGGCIELHGDIPDKKQETEIAASAE